MLWFLLARELGSTVAEIQRRMSMSEFWEWMGYLKHVGVLKDTTPMPADQIFSLLGSSGLGQMHGDYGGLAKRDAQT